jgi:hypothetical protein
MGAFLLYPTEMIWGRVQSGGEVKELDQVLGHEVLLDFVVQYESSLIMFNMTIMCKHGCIRGVGFIICHQGSERDQLR